MFNNFFTVFFVLFIILHLCISKDFRMCPPSFLQLGHKCYFFSAVRTSWMEAHYDCVLRKSSLATIRRPHQQHLLENFQKRNQTREEYWIGGKYNEKKNHWVWGASGDLVKFNAFSERVPLGEHLCVVLDPEMNFKWNARNCLDNKLYICQTNTNVQVELKLTMKKSFEVSKCGDLGALNEVQRNMCRELLGNEEMHHNEPAQLRRRKSRKGPTKSIVCTPNSLKLDNKCYIFSKTKANFYDASQDCRANNSKLAVLKSRKQDHQLRAFLNSKATRPGERWISGIYDWKGKNWKTTTGEVLKYKGFDRDALASRDLFFTGVVMDPSLKNKWNARLLSDEKLYICQLRRPRRIIKQFQQPNAYATISITTVR